MMSKRRTVCLVLLAIGAPALVWASGVALWLALGMSLIGIGGALIPDRRSSGFAHAALVVGSVCAGLVLFESALWVLERAASDPLPVFDPKTGTMPLAPDLPPEIETRIERLQNALVMPPAWRKRDLADIPGTDPFIWHGVIHPIDANGMRREEPFPPKDPERFRIVAVGDSLTYGEGVDDFWAYPAQLERLLQTDFQVEVLNLGVRGYASEDILELVRRFVPALEPDLVVYGVCLNDFLESGANQPEPFGLLPRKLRKILMRRTRVARLVDERSGALRRALGIDPNFYTELLSDLDARERRFGNDVAAMNDFVTEHGLPPILAIVLDQAPRLDGPGRGLAIAAERQMRNAGAEVLDSEEFYQRYDGRTFRVSRWEGHPNEQAHAIFASMLAEAIRERPELATFRQPTGVTAGASS